MMIGIDWGGTGIKAGVVEGANVRQLAALETRTGAGPQAILDDIAALILRLNPAARQAGVAIPGEVRADGRCWRLPNVAGFEDVNISAELQQRTGCEIAVENDAIAAALGERLYGCGNA